MAFVHSYPIPVADHFLAFGVISEQNSSVVDDSGETASTNGTAEGNCPRDSPAFGEVCETCYAYYANKEELWKHVRNEHSDDQRLVCPMSGCGKQFLSVAMSVAHTEHHKIVQRQMPLTCELCGRLLGNLSTFRKHMAKTHPDAVAAMCGVCYLYTGDVPSLIDHVRRRHGVASGTSNGKKRGKHIKQVIRCDVCGKQYGNYRNMYKHRAVHGAVDFDLQSPFAARSSLSNLHEHQVSTVLSTHR